MTSNYTPVPLLITFQVFASICHIVQPTSWVVALHADSNSMQTKQKWHGLDRDIVSKLFSHDLTLTTSTETIMPVAVIRDLGVNGMIVNCHWCITRTSLKLLARTYKLIHQLRRLRHPPTRWSSDVTWRQDLIMMMMNEMMMIMMMDEFPLSRREVQGLQGEVTVYTQEAQLPQRKSASALHVYL